MEGFGRRVALAIELRGTTKNAVEVLAGMKRGHLSRICSGKRKDIEASTLWKISQALDITCEWLLSGNGPIERSAVREETPRSDTVVRPTSLVTQPKA